MKKQLSHLPEIKLVGIATRTCNADEMNPNKAKIGQLMGHYWQDSLSQKIMHRAHLGKTYAVYTEYESDEKGEYTYLLGEEVTSFDDQPQNFKMITIPPARYQKFTTDPGQVPNIIISAWRQIWLMGESDLGGKRAFQADFEVIDANHFDPERAVFDIYVGLK